MGGDTESKKRGYDLSKRLVNMDQTRRSVLQAARHLLEAAGYRQMTMASLAAQGGVTRQTIHNLFGSKRAVLEALFDSVALEGGMERMRDVMTHAQPEAMLRAFVQVFCNFWEKNRALFQRIHGLGAIDPDLGELVEARNHRRHTAALRVAKRFKGGTRAAAALTALTSFEFYDVLASCGILGAEAEAIIFALAVSAMNN